MYNSGWVNGPIDALYHVRGARLLSQGRVSTGAYDANFVNANEACPSVFADSVRLRASTTIGSHRTYEFVLDVLENQPAKESVEEITTTGVTITVFNENGVVVCRNDVKTPINSDPTPTDGPGESTSEPIDGPGEMTSEPIDGPGESTSEPIDAPGETASEPI